MEEFIFAIIAVAIVVSVTAAGIVDRVYEHKEKIANCETKK